MASFAAVIIGLILGAASQNSLSPYALVGAAGEAADNSSQSCEAAKKAAAAGVVHGSQVSESMGVFDKCIAAVYDGSNVSVVELNPRGNPKNYRCVGKNVRLTISSRQDSSVIESWSAAPNVPAGQCATMYCVGSHCNQAKLYDGAGLESDSSGIAGSDSNSGADLSESERDFWEAVGKVEQQKNTELSRKIDDAFNDISAIQYKKDANGVPDVTQPVNPELAEELDRIAHNEWAVEQHEKSDVSPETRNSPLYQDMIARSQGVKALSPEEYALDWKQGGFIDTFPLVDTAHTPQGALIPPKPETPSTFVAADGHFWNGWRLSENVEQQTWGEYIVANTKSAVTDIGDWIQETKETITGKIKGFFVR